MTTPPKYRSGSFIASFDELRRVKPEKYGQQWTDGQLRSICRRHYGEVCEQWSRAELEHMLNRLDERLRNERGT